VQAPQVHIKADLFPQTWKWTCAIFHLASQLLTLTIF